MIEFRPIPGRTGCTALTIYRPGEFMPGDKAFGVFVGGSGVGAATTLAAAKTLLLKRARGYCQRHIDDALVEVDHYRVQLARLHKVGLEAKR